MAQSTRRHYDMVVRVDYDYENEYGDRRSAYTVYAGEASTVTDTPEQLAKWLANQLELSPPNDDLKRLINRRMTLFTYNEVENV